MEEALLSSGLSAGSSIRVINSRDEDLKNVSWARRYVAEAKKQFLFAFPMVGMSILQYLLNLVAVIVVGHLGKLELASCSLATTMVNISGHILLLALASALETFCGQAFGAKQFSLVGLYTQQATIVLCLISIPLAFIWFYMDAVLLLMGQDPLIADMAGKYARCLLPSLFASAITQPLVKFFQCQGETYPMAVCQLVALMVHLPLIYILMWPMQLGYLGAAISTSVAWWVNLLMMLAYLRFSGLPTFELTWTGVSVEALNPRQMWKFMQLAIPSALMICLEYWCFEMIIIFAGMLPDPELNVSVISVGYNIVYLSWVTPYGFSTAVSTRLANEFGSNRPLAARFAARVAYSMILGIMLCVAAFLLSFPRSIASVFVSDAEVITAVVKFMPFVALICFNDGFTGINAGSIRGIGHQHLGAVFNLLAYYGISIPTSYLLAFHAGLGVAGLWSGLAAGQGSQVILLASLVLLFTDWEGEARKAAQRLESEEESPEEGQQEHAAVLQQSQGVTPALAITKPAVVPYSISPQISGSLGSYGSGMGPVGSWKRKSMDGGA